MFYLTEQDPNFRIKGSRDPLGFQTIWQSLGRTVIKYLSTVSSNLKDFQVLSYAWYFYGDRDPKHFLNFFFKFEQACGFARGEYLKNDGFNGIDFVRKNLNKDTFSFSTKNEHTLLSNQKSYGIYGKYNRPYTEMRIKEDAQFREVMEVSLKEKVNYSKLEQFVSRLLNEEVTVFSKEELEIFAKCLESISSVEQSFYERLILRTEGNHVQNDLFDSFRQHPELFESTSFSLYGFIDSTINVTPSNSLKDKFDVIKKAEQVLMPYSSLFRTIQSEPTWTRSKVEDNSIFESFPQPIHFDFNHAVLDALNSNFSKSPFEKSETIIERNRLISEKRKNAAWIKIEGDQFITCYADGGRKITNFDIENDFENNYFIPTYISLYNQIMNDNG